MDLFDLLVRLDADGWKSFPPRDAIVDVDSPELVRLLRKASALEREGVRYVFTGIEGVEAPFVSEPRALCIAEGDRAVFLLAGPTCLLVAVEHGQTTILANSLAGFLEQLLNPAAVSRTPAQPLGDLGHHGEGWGWAVEDLSFPSLLDERPDALADEALHVTLELAWVGHRIREVEDPASTGADAGDADAGPDLGELFGGAGRPRPRTGLVAGLLLVGVVSTVLGMACIAAPGGILVLLAWVVVEKDHDRIESGYLPDADRTVVERSRNLTHAGLLLVVLLFFLQAMLLCFGGYDALLDQVYIPLWRRFVLSMMGVEDTDLPL